jgi:hypothetical protein
MPSARASSRGAFLNARFIENGMKNGEFSSDVPTASGRALSFMVAPRAAKESGPILARQGPPAYTFPQGREDVRGRVRKRSAAITLVLAGGATLGGCGSPVEQRDAYTGLQGCVKDWGDSSLCEPVKDGRYSSSYVYGPPYYATGGWSFLGRNRTVPSPNAMEAMRLPTGSVASSALSARAIRMGVSGGGSAGISRGGFGSSAHASSSSSPGG